MKHPEPSAPVCPVNIPQVGSEEIDELKALAELATIVSSIKPALVKRGMDEAAIDAEIGSLPIWMDETAIVNVLEQLYLLIGHMLFPISYPEGGYIEEMWMHLRHILVEPQGIAPIGMKESWAGCGRLETQFDQQLLAIFHPDADPIHETFPYLKLVPLEGTLFGQALIQNHHGNSWQHWFGWYVLALIHETNSFFFDQPIYDEWIYEEVWIELVWHEGLVEQLATAWEQAEKIDRKIERLRRWLHKNLEKRQKEILKLIRDFQKQKIRTYFQEHNGRFFRYQLPHDEDGLLCHVCTAHSMEGCSCDQLPGLD
ncbi:MAG: hypothetical protein AAF902_01065 [Chloroflexota bacterium]